MWVGITRCISFYYVSKNGYINVHLVFKAYPNNPYDLQLPSYTQHCCMYHVQEGCTSVVQLQCEIFCICCVNVLQHLWDFA